MIRNLLPLWLTASTLIYALCFIIETDAGKGKGNRQGHIIIQNEIKDRQPPVPIYIPIPIPMPMGPPGGGKPFNGHHHHQHQQNNEGDSGEVKKIYLLQPMPRVQPVPQLKGGGFMGPPVQTHIHVPAPIVQQTPGKPHHLDHVRPGHGFNDVQDDGAKTGGHTGNDGAGHHHHHSDMKILPIVVIPPIAPIQMPHSHESRKIGGEHHHQMHDQRSFSNYGGSVGGSTYRKTFGPRGKLRASTIDQSADAMDHFGLAASRARSSRNRVEDFGDDYEMSAPQTPRSSNRYGGQRKSARQAPGWNSGSGRRWSNSGGSGNRRKVMFHGDGYAGSNQQQAAGSIRDIIDQQRQVVFDDDLGGNGEIGRRGAADCCHEPRRGSLASRYQAADSSYMSSDAGRSSSEQREMPVRSRVSHGETPISSTFSDDSLLADKEPRSARQHGGADLTNLYYDRELQSNDELSFSSHPRSEHSSLLGRYDNSQFASDVGRRKFLDDSELLEDDEWAFDSVKSVTHADFPSNATSITEPTSINNTTATNSTTSTTFAPLLLTAKPSDEKIVQ